MCCWLIPYSGIIHECIPILFINDRPIRSTMGKANALNSQSLQKNLLTIPTMDSHTDVPSMPNITISQFGIHQLLTTLMNIKLVTRL